MKWTVHALQQIAHKGGLQFDETIDFPQLVAPDDSIRAISPVQVSGRADIYRSHAVFHLSLRGELTLPCSRTLADVIYPFQTTSIETFSWSQTETFDDEADSFHKVTDSVELLPILEELILLEVPIQVFSDNIDPSMQSGKDWSVVTEDDLKEKIDPRLAGLAKFFEKNNPE